jgi:hypothetical protein
MSNIPIIVGESKPPTFPLKNIQITPNGDVIVQIALEPGWIVSTMIITRDEMANIDAMRKEILLQQQKELQIARHALETKQ